MEQNFTENITKEKLHTLYAEGQLSQLLHFLEELPVVDALDFLEELTTDEIIQILKQITPETAGEIFSEFSLEGQLDFFSQIDRRSFAKIFKYMYSDVRADLYQELDKIQQIELLPYLDKQVRENVIILSAYPPETAGGIMNTDFATIFADMTALEALEKIRSDAPSKEMVYYIYVVDSSMVLKGLVTLKDLVLAPKNNPIEEVTQDFIVYAEVNEDRESVARKIEKYDLVAIPIVNSLHQLVGIVGHEDALDVIVAEQTEDMEKLMGIMSSTEDSSPYLSVSSMTHFRKRVFWPLIFAGVGIFSGMIINNYQHVLEQFIILALYMPMMAATGGNIGSQTAAVVIRSLSLGEIDPGKWAGVVFKEVKISLLLAMAVALLTYIKIVFFSFKASAPEGSTLSRVGIAISLAITIQVVASAVIGAALPLLVRKLNGDPAVVASPAISTIMDITGLLIYFNTTMLFLY